MYKLIMLLILITAKYLVFATNEEKYTSILKCIMN